MAVADGVGAIVVGWFIWLGSTYATPVLVQDYPWGTAAKQGRGLFGEASYSKCARSTDASLAQLARTFHDLNSVGD